MNAHFKKNEKTNSNWTTEEDKLATNLRISCNESKMQHQETTAFQPHAWFEVAGLYLAATIYSALIKILQKLTNNRFRFSTRYIFQR